MYMYFKISNRNTHLNTPFRKVVTFSRKNASLKDLGWRFQGPLFIIFCPPTVFFLGPTTSLIQTPNQAIVTLLLASILFSGIIKVTEKAILLKLVPKSCNFYLKNTGEKSLSLQPGSPFGGEPSLFLHIPFGENRLYLSSKPTRLIACFVFRIRSFEFEEKGFTFEIPKQLALSDCAYRVLFTKYDHLSPQCRTFTHRKKTKKEGKNKLHLNIFVCMVHMS